MNNFSEFRANDNFARRNNLEERHPYRSEYERDRDRILYSKAFRRLSGKTQVFVAGSDDHVRTRLTHTLEVSQISKTISHCLNLNEALTEAIALGHDIGHTPFGHVAERTLNQIMNGCYSIKGFNTNLKMNEKGFKHNWQGVRVVSELDQINSSYCGLNLTNHTMWGILNHSNTSYKPCSLFNNKKNKCTLSYENEKFCVQKGEFKVNFYTQLYNSLCDNTFWTIDDTPWTIEGLVVTIADEIAQRHHDVEDGIESNIIDMSDLSKKFKEEFDPFLSDYDKVIFKKITCEKDKAYFIPLYSKLIVNLYTTILIKNTATQLSNLKSAYSIQSSEDFHLNKMQIYHEVDINNIVNYPNEFKIHENNFQNYLKSKILKSYKAQTMDGKADYIVKKLFKAYITNPQQLPDKTIITLYKRLKEKEAFLGMNIKEDNTTVLIGEIRDKLDNWHFINNNDTYRSILLRTICDFVSGMTDNYALQQYSKLYESKII